MKKNSIDYKSINAMRYLGLKSIQSAKGGHVGMTISAAPITYVLYTKFIKINPHDGKWINRDRFVLSGGHGSMSVYPILYMAGLLEKQEMINFKFEDSKTPGHPEFENLKDNFIDASTGPLGQGIAIATGLALGEKISREKYGNPFPGLFDNYTYVVCGDGDLQEGISYEAMAIAGKYNLNKLIVLHDSNKFQLDSAVEAVSIENLKLRAESNNWFYQKCSNDPEEIEKAILNAQASNKPSYIEVETVIAESLSNGNTNKGHHGVVSDEELQRFNQHFETQFNGWDMDQEIINHFKENVFNRGIREFSKWDQKLQTYKTQNPNEIKTILAFLKNKVNYKDLFNSYTPNQKGLATRIYLKELLSTLNKSAPLAIATCADVASSTNILIGDKTILEGGQNLPIGIREFAMGAIMNGLSLYGIKPIGGTFLVFADYIKSAIRLGAMMHLPNVYAFTHDSYQVGGDGPTHQPYDQLPMLRSIENVIVHRPCDDEELRQAMIESYNSKTKTHILILSRQNMPSLHSNPLTNEEGFNVVKDCEKPDYVFAASGSEVDLAMQVAQHLPNSKVISIPCLQKVTNLDSKTKTKLFKARKMLVTIEASADYSWLALHLQNQKNTHIGAYTFGKSMDGEKLYKDKGFSVDKILKAIS